MRLTRWLADYYLCGWGQVLNAVVPAGARDKAGTRLRIFIEALPEKEAPTHLPAKQAAVLQYLREVHHPVELRELIHRVHCGLGPVEALASKGLVRRIPRRMDRFIDTGEEPSEPDGPITLNEDQQRVWSQLEPALHGGGFQVYLLHGVTGSGKTEIYLRAIEEVVRQGKEALVLVPEISLTPQTIARFQGRCGETAVMHSHLGDAEPRRPLAAGRVGTGAGRGRRPQRRFRPRA